ncbi:MAG: cell division protein ZapA [Acidobacteria bacterium]|nr:cell division protein ZapA [Acidobacteriota bacterium]
MASRSAESKSVRVTICNQTYTLGTLGDPAELEAAANAVDERMRDIMARAGNIDTSRVAVLACLHFADELRSLQRELDSLRTRIDTKSREFSLLLDKVID